MHGLDHFTRYEAGRNSIAKFSCHCDRLAVQDRRLVAPLLDCFDRAGNQIDRSADGAGRLDNAVFPDCRPDVHDARVRICGRLRRHFHGGFTNLNPVEAVRPFQPPGCGWIKKLMQANQNFGESNTTTSGSSIMRGPLPSAGAVTGKRRRRSRGRRWQRRRCELRNRPRLAN